MHNGSREEDLEAFAKEREGGTCEAWTLDRHTHGTSCTRARHLLRKIDEKIEVGSFVDGSICIKRSQLGAQTHWKSLTKLAES